VLVDPPAQENPTLNDDHTPLCQCTRSQLIRELFKRSPAAVVVGGYDPKGVPWHYAGGDPVICLGLARALSVQLENYHLEHNRPLDNPFEGEHDGN